jgi:hypothetical protein
MSENKLYNKLCNIKNLELAWARLKTGQNIQYKNYYRELFLAYELRQNFNLKGLSDKLKGYSYEPHKILKLYIPKSSGLQRPLTFLYLDDLIVYQALTNVISSKFQGKRKSIENNYVFSNILNPYKSKNIFFFKKWQEGYKKFIHKIKTYYNEGNIWVAHFDLAAYYDTISHNVLAEQISKKTDADFKDLLKKCLATWATNKSHLLYHGIPQGPIASSLIGEIFLLPIDITLKTKGIKYVRYVDDIKIFGKTRRECLESIIFLEKECKERGLIPQSKKYEILKAEKVEDAIGKFPSLSGNEKNKIFSNPSEAANIFKIAISEKNFDISRVKYILKVSNKNDEILKIVLNNLKQYPDLISEFCQFLINYSSNSKVARIIFAKSVNDPSEYEFVEGKIWELLSNFSISKSIKDSYINVAIDRLKQAGKKPEKPALRIGIYKFLASTGNCLVIPWLKQEKYAFIQMLIIPFISHSSYKQSEFLDLVNWFLKRSNYEPALVSIKQLLFASEGLILQSLDKPKKDDSGVLNNILGSPEKIDPVGQILKKMYEIPNFDKWKKFFEHNRDYEHSNLCIYYAYKSYFIDKNAWVNYSDSFNDIVIRKFVNLLQNKLPNIVWPPIINRDGKNIDIGVIMDKQNQLSQKYPRIIDNFREFHIQRNGTPISHAFVKKSGNLTKIITSSDQKKLKNYLRNGYNNLITVLSSLL